MSKYIRCKSCNSVNRHMWIGHVILENGTRHDLNLFLILDSNDDIDLDAMIDNARLPGDAVAIIGDVICTKCNYKI